MTNKPDQTLEELAALERDLRLFLAQEEHERLHSEAELSRRKHSPPMVHGGETPPASGARRDTQEASQTSVKQPLALDPARQKRRSSSGAHTSETAAADPAGRYPLPMAASTKVAKQAETKTAAVVQSERIRIDENECSLEYTASPFQVYLRGEVPAGKTAFEAGGKRWPLSYVEPNLHAVADLELWQIDRFKGVGRWTK